MAGVEPASKQVTKALSTCLSFFKIVGVKLDKKLSVLSLTFKFSHVFKGVAHAILPENETS